MSVATMSREELISEIECIMAEFGGAESRAHHFHQHQIAAYASAVGDGLAIARDFLKGDYEKRLSTAHRICETGCFYGNDDQKPEQQ